VYDAVVLDSDGVLVGRTPFDTLREAAWDAFVSVGVEDPDLAHVDDIAVGVDPATLADICDRYGIEPGEFWRVRDETATAAQIDAARAGRKTPYEDVDALRALDASLGVVSSNQQATVDALLDHFGLADRFEVAYGREPSVASLSRKNPPRTTLNSPWRTLTLRPHCSSATTSRTFWRPTTPTSTPRSSDGRTDGRPSSRVSRRMRSATSMTS